MTATLRATVLLPLLLAAGCSKPEPPRKERPPEPQATELRDAIQRPIARAKAVEPQVLERAQQERDAIEAQANGEDAAPPAAGSTY